MKFCKTRAGGRLFLVVLFLAVPWSAASPQVPEAGRGTSRPQAPRGEHAPPTATTPVFEFHSSFWMNLHHFLYQQARLPRESSTTDANDETGTPAAHLESASAALTAAEAADWQAALAFYRAEFAGRDLLFATDLVRIKNRLAELQNAADLQQSGLRPELVETLERAAAVYRRHWWPEHDRQNRHWVEQAAALVEQFGPQLAEKLAAVYQAPWPAGRIWVDVTFYAGRTGGYTSLEPLHVTIASADPRNQGLAALEVLFHEASHALAGRVRETIEQSFRARGSPIRRDLWHAILFYTTGEMVRRTLREAGEETYLPYGFRHDLYARGWQQYLRLIEQHWKPYLDGRVEFERALTRLVNAF
ncbi:MAG: hypothetical protein K6U09_05105 [Acidobacteriia bacterium]|jgi:hypothetical protein|nr:hypothetical protein [Terriglobia bacterium]